MVFDLRTFVSLKLHEARGRAGLASPTLLLAQSIVYPLVHAFLAIDRLVHPEIAQVPVERPVFIVGFPRSGTTLLFHLLASDPSMASYDLYRMILPSITLRRAIPPRAKEWFVRHLEPWFRSLDAIHPIRAEQPEEDEILFLLLGNSGISSYLFPYGELAERLRLNRFWEWPERRRSAYVRFYQGCLQRLLWDTGRSRYVGKSPHFLGKIDDLHRQYPDACFIYCIRSPYECVPSALSFITAFWSIAHPRPIPAAAVAQLYRDLIALWLYGDGRIDALPPENRHVVRYEDLVNDPRRTVHGIYTALRLPVPIELDALLTVANARQRRWQSRHWYSLEQFGLSIEQIETDLGPVLERHGFSRPGAGGNRPLRRVGM